MQSGSSQKNEWVLYIMTRFSMRDSFLSHTLFNTGIWNTMGWGMTTMHHCWSEKGKKSGCNTARLQGLFLADMKSFCFKCPHTMHAVCQNARYPRLVYVTEYSLKRPKPCHESVMMPVWVLLCSHISCFYNYVDQNVDTDKIGSYHGNHTQQGLL